MRNPFYQLQPYSNELARKYLNFLYLSQFSSKYGGLSLTAEKQQEQMALVVVQSQNFYKNL